MTLGVRGLVLDDQRRVLLVVSGGIAAYKAPDLVRRLQEYRTGTTTEQDHHLFDMMATVAKNLSDEEIQSLGSYLQGLHPRDADAAQATTSAPPKAG